MDDHLGYVKGDPAGNGSGNSRNGSYGKTLTTTSGSCGHSARDRKSAFEPQIVVKGQRRVGQVDEMILSLYARGMTTRDIHAHLAEIYGVEVSSALVSAVTDVVSDEIAEWQNRPLDAFYAILYIDALVVKVRDGGAVDNKAALPGHRRRCGRLQARAGHLAGRGRGIAVLGGRARRAPQPRNQGRPVRLLRRTQRPARRDRGRPGARRKCRPALSTSSGHQSNTFPGKTGRRLPRAMRPIYTALNEAAAETALENLRRDFGKREFRPGRRRGTGPGTEFIPFLEFDSAIRKVIYTTNAIESS